MVSKENIDQINTTGHVLNLCISIYILSGRAMQVVALTYNIALKVLLRMLTDGIFTPADYT